MGKKKMVMRRLAALLAASLVLTGSAFTSLAATESGNDEPKLTLEAKGTELKAGDEGITITAAITPATPGNAASVSNAERALSWSADPNLVTISPEKGNTVTVKVTDGIAVEEDTEVTITATGELSVGKDKWITVTDSCKVTVKAEEKTDDSVSPTVSLTMVPQKLELKVNGEGSLKVTLTKENDPDNLITSDAITWDVNPTDSKVIEINGKGEACTVTAKSAGTAKVIAKISGENYKTATAECEVTVTPASEPIPDEKPVATLEMNPKSLAFVLDVDGPETVVAELTSDPEGSISEEDITWSFKYPDVGSKVVKLTPNGSKCQVEAIGAGKATLIATVAGKNYDTVTAECEITVTKVTMAEAPAVDDVEGIKDVPLNETQKQAVETKIADGTDKVNKAAVEVAKQNISSDSVKNLLDPTKPENKELIAALGEDVTSIDVVLTDVAVVPQAEVVLNDDGTPKLDKDGNPEVRVVVKEFTVHIDAVDQDGKTVDLLQAGNKTEVTVRVKLPKEGILPEWKHAVILHKFGADKEEKLYSEIFGTDDRYVNIVTSHFSPFTMTFYKEDQRPVQPITPTPGYSGGRSSGGSRTTTASAQWIQNATGWWYKNADGTWPANTWVQLTWNNTSSWYRFNAEGYMVAGWFTDADQNRYFLHNVSDGTQGHMYTGWHQIDGVWYYFRENVGGPMGSLVVNGVTPDGYQVDANGAWIQ